MKHLLLLSLLYPSLVWGQTIECGGNTFSSTGGTPPEVDLCHGYEQIQSDYEALDRFFHDCAAANQQYQDAIDKDGGLVACPDDGGPCEVVTCAKQLKKRNLQFIRAKRRIVFLEKRIKRLQGGKR